MITRTFKMAIGNGLPASPRRVPSLASRLKSSAAKLFLPPIDRRAPLLFDSLEPRLLLSADALAVDLAASLPAQQDHQVLVRLVEAAEQTQSAAASQQRIEIVDQSSGTVLASGDAGAINRVSLNGGAGEDRVVIDAASFAGRAAPSIAFDGGGGANTLQVQGAQDTTWQLGAPGAGALSGALVIDFSHVGRLIAGSGNDTLKGGIADTDWQVTGAGSGTVGTRTFAGFEKLVGAADNHDTFTFSAGGSMAQGVDGSAGGYDTLVLDNAQGLGVVSMPTGAQSGAMIVGDRTIAYDGLEPIITTGASSLTLYAWGRVDAELRFRIGIDVARQHGRLVGDQSFTASTLTSLTIYAYQTNGTPGPDGTPANLPAAIDLTLASIDSGFTGALTINANTLSTTLFGGDQTMLDFFGFQDDLTQIVRVGGAFGLSGASLTINAEQVLIGTTIGAPTGNTTGQTPSVEYSDLATTGGHGSGMKVDVTVDDLGEVSVHVVDAGSGYQINDTVTVTPNAAIGPLTFTVLNVLAPGQAGASINTGANNAATAGAIAINAFDIRIGPDATVLAQGRTADNTVTITASNENFRYLTLPISWEWNPLAATVEISGATITGSAVTITATSEDVPGITQSSNFLATFLDGYLQGVASSVVTFLISTYPGWWAPCSA